MSLPKSAFLDTAPCFAVGEIFATLPRPGDAKRDGLTKRLAEMRAELARSRLRWSDNSLSASFCDG